MNIKVFRCALFKTLKNIFKDNSDVIGIGSLIMSIAVPFVIIPFLFILYKDSKEEESLIDALKEGWTIGVSFILFLVSNVVGSFIWLFSSNIISMFCPTVLPFAMFNLFSIVGCLIFYVILLTVKYVVKQFKENYEECKKESEQ